jgi:glycosyltransferase involved in cell wall biosynthesis
MFDDQRIHKKNDARPSKSPEEEGSRQLSDAGKGSKEASLVSSALTTKKIVLIHDWLNGARGGEIVFESLLDLFPNADVMTLIYEPQKCSDRLRKKLEARVVAGRKVEASFLNHFSFTRRYYRQLLPLLPFAIRTLDVYPYDWVISSSHCVAKGVKKHPKAFHLAYLHAPMRYMWDRFEDYFGFGKVAFPIRLAALLLRPVLQAWDRFTSAFDRIDVLIANSKFIADQIYKAYGRTAEVVYPFARLERFQKPRTKAIGGFYLMVGAFAPYKRTDLAIQAFLKLGLPLKIVGDGQDDAYLRRLVQSADGFKGNIEFLGNPSNEVIESLYSECKAFVFPGKEDFGITPLEAMASGAPVIAFGEGGAAETVIDAVNSTDPHTGIYFYSQTVDALVEAVMNLESGRVTIDEQACRRRAEHFTEARFQEQIMKHLPTHDQM